MKTEQHLPTPTRKGTALRLVSTTNLDREQWLTVRKGGIGSSDAAAAVGLNPYKSQLALWLEKTGRDAAKPQIDPNDDSTPAFWGTILEPIVATQYSKRTGLKVRKVNAVLQHSDPDLRWMMANLDREVVGSAEVQILECKTAGINGARLWKDGVPEYVQLQVMHQLAVTGKQAADIAVLIGGQELEIHRIERDEKMIANLIELERRFWQYVVDDTPPPADGSDSADQALRCLYPQDNGRTLDLSGNPALNVAYVELKALKQTISKQQQRESELKQLLQQAMGDVSRATFAGGQITWKRSKDSTVLDTDRLLNDNPDLKARYSKVKEGSRRFLIS
ncbi:MAG: alkaline phosphatase [Pseudomonas sp.]|nr:alkaline phosphatase [Pseudomonas sp.]MBB49901.1 alkaline phosphatase [Pseudomonadales bacterium]|tara:strand:+ start:2184 stop:3188 length:1005 start_codon:yes stop_codon:yes gene_type:complete